MNVHPPSQEFQAYWLDQLIVIAFFEINMAVAISTNHTLAVLQTHDFFT